MGDIWLGVLPVAGMGAATCLLFLLSAVVRKGRAMGLLASTAVLLLGGGPVLLLWNEGGRTVQGALLSSDRMALFFDGIFVLDPGIWGQAGGLTPGATVYTNSVPDIKQLYDVGKNQTGLFGLDCETIWLGTLIGFPCGSMLSPFNSEADRLALQATNLAYNQMLASVAPQANALSPNLYWDFSWAVWNHAVQGNEISSIDCFHPSSDGQRALAAESWADGPFGAF